MVNGRRLEKAFRLPPSIQFLLHRVELCGMYAACISDGWVGRRVVWCGARLLACVRASTRASWQVCVFLCVREALAFWRSRGSGDGDVTGAGKRLTLYCVPNLPSSSITFGTWHSSSLSLAVYPGVALRGVAPRPSRRVESSREPPTRPLAAAAAWDRGLPVPERSNGTGCAFVATPLPRAVGVCLRAAPGAGLDK